MPYELIDPNCHLQTERYWHCGLPMRPAEHHSVPFPLSHPAHGADEILEGLPLQRNAVLDLESYGGIHYVIASSS